MSEQTDVKVVPYCGGCGHRFYGEPEVSEEEARRAAVTRRCRYCRDDEAADRSEPTRVVRKDTYSYEEMWFDF